MSAPDVVEILEKVRAALDERDRWRSECVRAQVALVQAHGEIRDLLREGNRLKAELATLRGDQ